MPDANEPNSVGDATRRVTTAQASGRQRSVAGIAIGLNALVVLVFAGLAIGKMVSAEAAFIVGYLAVMCVGLTCVVGEVIATRHLKRFVREHRGLVCLHCHYPLPPPPTPEEGRCPECGSDYVRSEVIANWKAVHKTDFV